MKICYIVKTFTIIILMTSSFGCTMPRYATGLDNVLVQNGQDGHPYYRYRCTRGAHRGSSEEYRENSQAALETADSKKKYAFIEFDVQYTKDKKIVVFHDKRLLRIYGNFKAVGDITFDELYDITKGEIVEYNKIINLLDKKLNIEIKSQGNKQDDEQLADEIMIDIRRRKINKNILISSISEDVLKYINKKYPDIPTGQIFWLTSSTYLHFDSLTKNLYDKIEETQADYLMLHVSNLRNIDNLLALKPKGKTIVFWDFDDTMYIVHKDLSDRLWGDSGFKTLLLLIRYKLASTFRSSIKLLH